MPTKPYGRRNKLRVTRAVAANRMYSNYGYKGVRGAQTLQAAVRRTLNKELSKKVETKKGNYTSTDGTEISHNNFITLNSKMLATTQGTLDPQVTSILNRVGDEITLKGVSIKFMVELDQRFSDVTMRFIIVKSAKGDTPTRDTLFNGLSGNKMIDTFNTERYTIITAKTFKIKAGNYGATTADGSGGIIQPSGYAQITASTYSRQTKIVKMYIPGTKFIKGGQLKYENGSDQPKFYDYHALLYAYSNWTTLQDLWNVGRINDYVQTMYYTDQ